MKRKRGESKERDKFAVSPPVQKASLLMDVQGSGDVTSPGASG